MEAGESSNTTNFAQQLGLYVRREGLSLGALARRGDLPKATLQGWLEGRARRPREWQRIVQAAAALNLSLAETDQLLALAGHPPLAGLPPAELRRLAQSPLARTLLERWLAWLDAPSPRSGVAPPQLAAPPAPTTALIGRARELAELMRLLGAPGVRLVTLTGPGGVGKTRLALAAAEPLRRSFTDGVTFVSLAELSERGLLLTAVAEAVGVKERPGQPLFETLKAALHAQHRLLILDNFEHLLAEAGLVGALLSAAPGLSVLATSRAALGVYGEQELLVPPLAVPSPAGLPRASELRESPAVQLFLARARAIAGPRSFGDAELPAVATICARLDGLPLALELAAVRTRVLSLDQLLGGIEQRLSLLSQAPRDLPPRQQTLRATIDWSYNLLGEAERRFFAGLAVFAGGWTLEHARHILADEHAVVALLDGLLRHSLVLPASSTGAPRWTLLATLREYALEQLERSGRLEELRDRHAAYMLALAEHERPGLSGARPAEALLRLAAEHDNLRAALEWTRLRGAQEQGLRFIVALSLYWRVYSYQLAGSRWAEGQLWADALLAQSVECRTPLRVQALYDTAWIARDQGNLARMERLVTEGLLLAQAIGDQRGRAMGQSARGYLLRLRGDYAAALADDSEALALLRAVGDPLGQAWVLLDLGKLAHAQSLHEEALRYFQESLALFQQHEQLWAEGHLLHMQGLSLLRMGAQQAARSSLGQALANKQQLNDYVGLRQVRVLLEELDALAGPLAAHHRETEGTEIF